LHPTHLVGAAKVAHKTHPRCGVHTCPSNRSQASTATPASAPVTVHAGARDLWVRGWWDVPVAAAAQHVLEHLFNTAAQQPFRPRS
jgi:hypothetical protein